MGLNKNGVKTPVCFSAPSAYCCGSYFPYESKLSMESPPHISSGAHATQKNKLTINRDKPLEHTNFALRTHRIITIWACKLHIENTYSRKQNKALSDILSPHIPYKNLEYEQKEKIQHDFLPV